MVLFGGQLATSIHPWLKVKRVGAEHRVVPPPNREEIYRKNVLAALRAAWRARACEQRRSLAA